MDTNRMIRGLTKRAVRAASRFLARRRMLSRIRRYEHANPYRGDGIRPQPFDVEKDFSEFVVQFGGTNISDLLLDKSARPTNADYLFARDNVVMELKTLEGSFAGKDGIPLLLNALSDAGVTQAQLFDYMYGGVRLPKGAWRLVDKRFRRFVEDRIRKARDQLRQSKRDFGNKTTRSVLLIVNDGVRLVGDDYIVGTICRLMAENYADEHIDAVVFFSGNVPSFYPGAEREHTVWFPAYRDKDDEILGNFINRLGAAWLRLCAARSGEPDLPILEFPDTSVGVETLRGRRRPH